MKKKEKINNDETKENKDLKDALIDLAVKKYKEGEIKNSEDVEEFLTGLLQPMMQRLLDAELDNFLEYSKYERKDNGNYRNGYCKPKEVKSNYGTIKVKTPRDRNGEFEPIIIEKGQTQLTGFEEKCISLYAKGVSLRDIEQTLNDFYGVKISKDQITKLISVVNEEVNKWKNRPLEPLYLFAYADCIWVPIKDESLVSEKKAVYVIIGVNKDGYKDILGLWIDKTESASFWTNVFEDLKTRGVQDIFYMCSDGVAGFNGSLETAFPKTLTQRCVVHLTRNIAKICPKSLLKMVISGWKRIYTSNSYEEAKLNLEQFEEDFKDYPHIVKKVKSSMQYIEKLFELPQEIRKAIYTTNAIESVNSSLRKVTRGKGSFPSDESVYKVLFLRIRDLKEKWKKPIKDFNIIQQQLIELFGDRYTKYLEL